jgi:two-component system, response regulator YesN
MDIAEKVNLSPDYLSKLFHKEVGCTISDFIQQQKLETALYFLEYSDLKVTEISAILEYCNPGHFTNTFKRYVQCTPIEYRKKLYVRNKEDV